MDATIKAIKGQIVYAPDSGTLCVHQNSWIVSKNGLVVGIFAELPSEYANATKEDFGDRLIIPGLVDLHVHAPQYSYRGTGMDLELLDWLATYTFPEEAKFSELAYAERAYSIFAEDLKKGATTRAAVFATVHTEATLLLMQLLAASGVRCMVGKVNMDRNCPDYICEDTAASLADTRAWLSKCQHYAHVRPILTPRFTPTCTDALLQGLGEIQREYGIAVQSHLSENPSEIAWVKALCPDTACYAESYARFGLLGGDAPTIMAHCVYPTPDELQLLQERRVMVAHCPQSNMNLASGIAPVRKYLNSGICVGLGTDIAGGANLSMLRAMADAIGLSKLRWRLVDQSEAPLTLAEVLFMATKGGGALFGRVGSFEEGYAFDAVVLSEEHLPHPQPMSIENRLERLIYLATDREVLAKYADGERIK